MTQDKTAYEQGVSDFIDFIRPKLSINSSLKIGKLYKKWQDEQFTGETIARRAA